MQGAAINKPNKVDDESIKLQWKLALKNCTWSETRLVLKLLQEKNAREEKIIRQIITEKRKYETGTL